MGIFVSLRLLTYPIRPEDLRPPYFVAMGAMAISVLAGARIVKMAGAPMVDTTPGLVAGTSVVFWAFASWLFPVLLAAGWWRYVIHKVPLSYEPGLWSVIFPLGMYAVAGIYLGRADQLPIVALIGRAELWLAAAEFIVTFAAMLWHLWVTLVRPGSKQTGRARELEACLSSAKRSVHHLAGRALHDQLRDEFSSSPP